MIKKSGGCTSSFSNASSAPKECRTGAREYASSTQMALFEAARMSTESANSAGSVISTMEYTRLVLSEPRGDARRFEWMQNSNAAKSAMPAHAVTNNCRRHDSALSGRRRITFPPKAISASRACGSRRTAQAASAMTARTVRSRRGQVLEKIASIIKNSSY